METSIRKRKQGERLTQLEKQTILSLLSKTLQDQELSLSSAVKTVSELCGVSDRTIFRIKKEADTHGLQTPSKTKKVPNPYVNARKFKYYEFYISKLRQTIHQFYRDNLYPTLNAVCIKMNQNNDCQKISRSTLHTVLHENGFVYEKAGKNSLLLERDDIILYRHNYLRQIKNARERNKNIIYTDESWVSVGEAVNKVWDDKTIKSVCQTFAEGLTTSSKTTTACSPRFALFHAGGETGFIPNVELTLLCTEHTPNGHKEIDGETYENWFQKILLPNCPKNSVIVLDNAKYHSRQTEAIPTTEWNKDNIKEWLSSHNIVFEDNALKRELLHIVQEHKVKYHKHIVDEIAKEAGVEVLRLPPYHCELNPMELVWGQVKQYVEANNKTFEIIDVQRLIAEAYEKVTTENWVNYVNHVKKIEDDMWYADILQDDIESLKDNLVSPSSTTEIAILREVPMDLFESE